MSTLKVNKLRDTSGSTDAIVLDPSGGAVLAGVTTISTARITTGITTSIQVGGGVTISESGIEASGIGITCASINGAQIGGRRNILINSEFAVNQRGDTSVAVGNGNYPCDRWKIANNGTLTGTMAVDTTTPTIDSNNFMKSIKVTSTSTTAASSAGDYAAIGQRLERNDVASFGWGTSNAQNVTLSFYVRSSKTGIFSAYLIGGNGFNRTFTFEYTIASADTWQKVVQTISGDTGGSWTYSSDNTIGLGLNFVLENLGSGAGTTSSLNSWQAGNNYAGSTNQVNLFDANSATWYVAGVQLEVGSQATAFEHRNVGEELSLCQRYFEKMVVNNYPMFPAGNNGANNETRIPFKVEKRAAPTVTKSGDLNLTLNGTTSTNTDHNLGSATIYGAKIFAVMSGSNYSASTAVSAFTCLADAEL